MAYRPASLLIASTVTPTAAGSVSLSSRFLLSDATYATGAQIQGLFGTTVIAATGASALAGVPASGVVGTALTGISTNLSPAGSTGYAVLYAGGADQGARVAFSGTALPNLTPGAAASTTVRVYAAASGGAALVESAGFTVSTAITTATGATLSGLTTSGIAGTALNMAAASVGLVPSGATAYAALNNGVADVGARVAFTGGTLPPFTPSSAGSYTYRVYAAASGGSPLAASPAIAVSPGSSVTNVNQVVWYGTPPAATFALTSAYNGYSYGSPSGGSYFKLTPTAGGADLANTTPVLCAWVPSITTAPPAGGPTAAGLNASNYANGYVAATAASAPFYNDNGRVAGVAGSAAQTYYFWTSIDGGSSWSLWRNGSNIPVGVTVSF